MSKKWATADLHLGNHGIIEHCNRPYKHVSHVNYLGHEACN